MSRAHLVRALVAGVAIFVIAGLVGFGALHEVVLGVGLGLSFAAATVASSVVESRASAREATKARDRRAALVSSAASAGLLVAGVFQTIYARRVIETRSIESGLVEVADRLVLDDKQVLLAIGAIATGAIFGVVTLVRLQQARFMKRMGYGVVSALIFPPIGGPMLALILAGEIGDVVSGAKGAPVPPAEE